MGGSSAITLHAAIRSLPSIAPNRSLKIVSIGGGRCSWLLSQASITSSGLHHWNLSNSLLPGGKVASTPDSPNATWKNVFWNLVGDCGGVILSVMTWQSNFSIEISPASATSSHPDLSLQTISLTSSLTSKKPPLPSGVTPISSSISLRRVKTDSLSPVLSANHSGWESAAFLSTLLTPPPGKDQRSGKAGSSGLLCPNRT